MEYSINKLAKLAGITTRTLRYYDEIGLLKPNRINSSGYRIYGENEVNILQQIMLYRSLELPLDKIKEIILSKDFNPKKALYEHKKNILKKQEELRLVLLNIEKTINSLEGGIEMSDKEKFEGLKRKMIQENEEEYGEEIRKKYGDNTIDKSNDKFANLTKDQFEEVQKLSIDVNNAISEAMKEGSPKSQKAKEAVELHKKWLSFFHEYPKEAYLGLVQMYVDDSRFTEYYENNVGKGAAQFLRDAAAAYHNASFDEEKYTWIFKE